MNGIEKGIAKGIALIARNLLDVDMPVEQISKVTGLTHEEVSNLRDAY
jgi:predicted transposase/invertase (TIGR01784 family)